MDEFKVDNFVEGINCMENVNVFLDGVKVFVEDDIVIDMEMIVDKLLASYLQNIVLFIDLDIKEDENIEYVILMLVYVVKGLEFKFVFVVGMEEKLFFFFMLLELQDGIDEECCLFYVAIIWVEQFFMFFYVNSCYWFGQMWYNEFSCFLQEVFLECLEEISGVCLFFGSNWLGFMDCSIDNGNSNGSSGVRVFGNFKKFDWVVSFGIDFKDFKFNVFIEIQAGMKVFYFKFGEGKVLSIDGGSVNCIVIIFFKNVSDFQQCKIMLKFVKL